MAKNDKFRGGLSLRKFLILQFITFGLYTIYWFYRSWKQINMTGVRKEKIRPGLRTLGLFVPVYNFWLAYDLFRDIFMVASKNKIKTNRTTGEMFLFFIVASFISLRTDIMFMKMYGPLAMLPLLIVLLPAVTLIPIQKIMNAYWAKERVPVENSFNCREVLIVCLFVIILLIYIVDSFFP